MKTVKEIWSPVTVLVPGNFASVHVSGLTGNYNVTNEKEFLEKFFNIGVDPKKCFPGLPIFGIMPDVKVKEEYIDLFCRFPEFKIKRVQRNNWKIYLNLLR